MSRLVSSLGFVQFVQALSFDLFVVQVIFFWSLQFITCGFYRPTMPRACSTCSQKNWSVQDLQLGPQQSRCFEVLKVKTLDNSSQHFFIL